MAPTDLESSTRLLEKRDDEDFGRFMDLQPSKLRPFFAICRLTMKIGEAAVFASKPRS